MLAAPLESRLLKATEPQRLVCRRCGFVFYLDPKVAVGTIIRDERNHVVLVRRAIEPGYGQWVFPGGYVDRGEEVHAAAVREAREEAGLDIRLDEPDQRLLVSGPGAGDHRLRGDDDRRRAWRAMTRGWRRGSSRRTRSRGTSWRSRARTRR